MSSSTNSIKLCFGTVCAFAQNLDAVDCEKKYQSVFKPLISALYALPELPFTLHVPGTSIEWMEREHPEFFMLLEEMFARKQIDILGGGYYSPLFPLIPPADRVGQIELLTTALRKHFGKRPRGVWLPASAWEPALVSSLCTCGIEYVLLDKVLIETSGFPGVDGFSPVTLEDNGKTITAIPLDNRFVHPERLGPRSFAEALSAGPDRPGEQVSVVFIAPESLAAVFSAAAGKESWMQEFVSLAGDPARGIELLTTSRTLRQRTRFSRACIPSGMSFLANAGIPEPPDNRAPVRASAKHLVSASENSMNVYAKTMYVHALVNQLRGDKSRKNNAREELWLAQNGEVFTLAPQSTPSEARALRQQTWRCLLAAEKSTRVRGIFSPSVITFDFDMDGLKEYLCQLEHLNMYVHPQSGRIFEFDVLDVSRNYCDLASPRSGFFVDHFLPVESTPLVRQGQTGTEPPVFSGTLYQELSFDPSRLEINLKTNGLFGPFQQPLSLRKQYSFRSEGTQVQYILKNESPLTLSGIFAVELDIAASENRGRKPQLAVYARDYRKDGPVQKMHEDDVSWIQLEDTDAKVKFTLEANENPSVTVIPVDGEGVRIFLYWRVDLGPNYETEKLVFLKTDA